MTDIDGVDSTTPAEQAVLDAETNRIAGEAAAAEAAKAAEVAAAAAEQAKAAADAAAAEQAKQAAAAAALPPAAPAAVFPTITIDEALAKRDLAAENAELNRKWEEGEITQTEWASTFAEIATASATLAAQQTMANAAKAAAEQSFEQAASAFLARPDNLDIATDSTRFKWFQDVINTIDNATGNALPANELLSRAHAEFRKKVPAPSAPAPPPPPPTRQTDLTTLPPRLTDIPQAGAHHDGESAEISQLASMGIQDLEELFAGKSDEQIERYLAATPGARAEIKPAA